MKKYILTIVTVVLGFEFYPAFGNIAITLPDGEGSQTGIITGIIAEQGTLDPMEYSTIAVYSADDSTLVGGTISGEDGKFQIAKLPFGQYYLETDYIGYNKRVIQPIHVTPESREVDLGTLVLSVSSQALDEVEIVGDRKHIDYRLDKKVISVSQDLNSAGGTAVDVLENTPSVTVDIEGNVSLRGSGSFTVLIDGKPSVLTGSDALRQIPASAIENIEIITNPSAKYDPDGNAGIINVVMKKSVEKGTNGILNASIGVNNKYRTDFLLNRTVNNWHFFIGGNYSNNLFAGTLNREQITFSDSVDSYLDADGILNFNFGGSQLKAGASYDLSDKSSLSLEASGGTRNFGIDRSNRTHEYSDPVTEDIYYVSSSLMRNTGNYYSMNASYTQMFDSKEHKLTAMAYYSRRTGNSLDSQDDYNTEPDYLLEDVIPESTRAMETSDEYQVRFQVDYSRPVGSSGKVETGYQIRIDDEFKDYIFEDFDPSDQVWNENPLYSSELTFFRNIQSAYATYGGELNGFQFLLGLRGEHTYRNMEHEISTETYLINRLDYYPTIHFSREFKNDNQLTLSYAKRVERPRGWNLDPNVSYVDPYTVRVGNPALEPEYIHSFELGYQKGWEMNFLAFELYYRKTNNLMTRITEYDEEQDLFILKRENLNEDHSAGAEIMANWKFWKFLTVNGSFTPYYYAIAGSINDYSVDESSFNWRSDLNMTFQITPTMRLQSNLRYRSKSVSAQGYQTGSFYTNLALRQDFFQRKLSATLQIRDLFGTDRRENFSFGENFQQHMVRVREPRILMLTLSYKINNYRFEPGNREGGGGEMDMGGGL